MKGNGNIIKIIGGILTALIILLLTMALNGASKAKEGVTENRVNISAMQVTDTNLEKSILRVETKLDYLTNVILGRIK
ncbi:unnamed protein product [marine sediment metagenome]|uniref:Uncharacterized protein n=1 Tax=marine sediment metagenome TaxID=412755 RepID=X1I5H9_9ZZZZ